MIDLIRSFFVNIHWSVLFLEFEWILSVSCDRREVVNALNEVWIVGSHYKKVEPRQGLRISFINSTCRLGKQNE